MKNEIDFLKEIEPYGFDDMDGNIACPNCGARMVLDGCIPEEEHGNFEYRATDAYRCPECGLGAFITSCFKLDHKEVEYDLDDMETEEDRHEV